MLVDLKSSTGTFRTFFLNISIEWSGFFSQTFPTKRTNLSHLKTEKLPKFDELDAVQHEPRYMYLCISVLPLKL